MEITFTKPRFSFVQVVLAVLVIVTLLAYFLSQQIQKKLEVYSIPVIILAEESAEAADFEGKEYSFTTDWFTKHIPSWSKALEPFANKPGVEYLEVGVFEGRAAVWMLDNILTHPTSRLTGMDLFEGQYENEYPDFAKRYFANIRASGASDRTTSIKGYSQIELRKLPLDSYDIIYIDGSHENFDVLEDAILSIRLLRKGGVLIFDDYARRQADLGSPKLGIQSFYRFYGEKFDLLHNDHQIIMRKK